MNARGYSLGGGSWSHAEADLAQPAKRCRYSVTGIPVFVYHGLISGPEVEVPPEERKYWLPSSQFRDQLSQIRQGCRRVISLSEGWIGTKVLPSERSEVVLTFDDGQASDYEVAYPLLMEAGARADFFVNTATIGKPGYLTWRQIVEMQRAGMSFQSHSHDHVDLTRLPIRILEKQLKDSKQQLEDRLGSPVDFLAVPHGLFNSRVVKAARQEGYRGICKQWSWPARPGARLVNRIPVYRSTSSYAFSQLLAQNPVWYLTRAARSAFVYVPKRLLRYFYPASLGIRVLEESA